MTLGERLFQYRNSINLSQEKLAEKIGVTRQTISKWETDQSTPDFDKIEPLCKVFGITTDELIKGDKTSNKEEIKQNQDNYNEKRNKKKAIILSISIFLYCIATFSLPYMVEVLNYEDAHAVMIWAGLCTVATVMLVFFFVAYPKKKDINTQSDIKEKIEEIKQIQEEVNQIEQNNKEVDTKNKTEDLAIEACAIFFLIIYLSVSFLTMAWHITWIIWLVFALVQLIIKLIFSMKGENNEK